MPLGEYKLGRHVTLRVDHTFKRMNVEGQRLFTAHMTRLKAVVQISKRCFIRGIAQYQDISRSVGLYNDPDTDPETKWLMTQALFSYKINPQTMLFIGYSDFHLGDVDYDITQTDRTFFAKLGYAWTL